MRPRLILFTRYPEPGRTKTRLIPHLGEEGAAALQRDLTEQAMSLARTVRERVGCDIEVRVTGAREDCFASWLGTDCVYRQQEGEDLGARMCNAFDTSFREGCARVVVMGTDCLHLRPHHLLQAFRALETHDLVLGPAEDGGYTLIGLSAPMPLLFEDIPWGTDTVFATTWKRASYNGKRPALLPRLPDIDRPEDLAGCKRQDGMSRQAPYLSVIIPTLNCANSITAVLESVFAEPGVEAIVVDGGSTDDTVMLAGGSGASVISAPRGRAHQMNAGVLLATTDRFLFLHGDTCVPRRYTQFIETILEQDETCLGAFELGIDASGLRFRLVEWLANLRSRWLSLPYGDQAFFLCRRHFESLGGFPGQPFLEDYDFVRKARRAGKVRIARQRISTSATRWRQKGVITTTFINQVILIGRALGVDPGRLKRIYRRNSNHVEGG